MGSLTTTTNNSTTTTTTGNTTAVTGPVHLVSQFHKKGTSPLRVGATTEFQNSHWPLELLGSNSVPTGDNQRLGAIGDDQNLRGIRDRLNLVFDPGIIPQQQCSLVSLVR